MTPDPNSTPTRLLEAQDIAGPVSRVAMATANAITVVVAVLIPAVVGTMASDGPSTRPEPVRASA
jgi:hypothetical protein